MRSRYSAFVREELDYLLATHPEPDRDPPFGGLNCGAVAARPVGRA